MKKVTLANLAAATPQEVFDQVATHLLTQGRECMYLGRCFYRLDGMMCAAGCLIGDDEYTEAMESLNWRKLVEMEKVPSAHEDLIFGLQLVHDSKPPQSWKECLRNVARDYHLNWAVVERDYNHV